MSITQEVIAQSHDKVLENHRDRIGIWKCWFLRRGENRSTWRKTSRSKDENQQQSQSRNRTQATLVGGECFHHCTIPASLQDPPPNRILFQRRMLLEQGWRSGESTRLPPMWPGFDSWTRRHVWVESVVGTCPILEVSL